MIKKKYFFYLMLIILVSALLVQVFKSGRIERILRVNQKQAKQEFETVSASLPEKYQRVLVAYSRETESTNKIYQNIYHTFRLAKIQAEFCSIDSTDLAAKIDNLTSNDLLVIAAEDLNRLNEDKVVLNHVANGGKVVFLIRSYYPEFNNLVGIESFKGEKLVTGFKFEQGLFPGLDGLEIETAKINNSILDVELKSKVEVLATAQKEPLIWLNNYGQGKVLYVNSNLMEHKYNRGLLLQYISYLTDYFLTTIFNGKLVNIDDFPAPIKQGKDDIIYEQYHMTNRQFYKNIWWSALYNMSQRYNLKYTGLVIGSYNLQTSGSLPDFYQQNLEDIKYFGRRLAEAGGELGIHGYNHNSLALAGEMNFNEYGYYPWESRLVMEKGLMKLKKALKSMYGDINVYTYVPPSNIISRTGKIAVKNIFPELKVLAGLYTASKEQGILKQEFGPDPDLPGVYCLPRLSSGYDYNPSIMWNIYNGIAHYGIFNHFIHPDDLLDEQRRKGRTWRELKNNLEQIFSNLYSHYSFLQPMTNLEGYMNYRKLEDLEVYSYQREDVIYIHYRQGVMPVNHFLRLRTGRISQVQGGDFQLLKEYGDHRLYFITGKQSVVKIELR
ncbi:DUF2194 domain-containing protein [Sporohalobacter salinus]|uniref:DUF2194 domain-containing protein n=1 Tax=Sporohalobacter salinus TaxID=1494606 RepID=UPI0019603C35|nr:DUF2194 domain-containing protein [Sporohalobacter salinus]MBM7624818.1 hypothetical protein [Sporohalobacter salinus]